MRTPIILWLALLLSQSSLALWSLPRFTSSPLSPVLPNLMPRFAPPACAAAILSSLVKSKNPLTSPLFQFSGKRANDLGDYAACRDSAGSRYILIGAYLGEVFLRVGLCLPVACSVSELSQHKARFAELLGRLAGIAGIDPSNLHILDVAKENREMASQSYAGAVVFWIVAGAIVGLSVLATVLDLRGRFVEAKSTLSKVAACFSLRRSITGFLKAENPLDPNLEIFNGVRVLTMLWIVICHLHESEMMTPTLNLLQFFDSLQHTLAYSYVKSGGLSVDVFFAISGFFAACSFFHVLRSPSERNWRTILKSYMYRYVRLLPILAFTICLVTFLIPAARDQPFNPYMKAQAANCRRTWYMPLLYVSNFQPLSDICVDWNWYLMNDMQFFLLAPFIVLPFMFKYLYGFLTLLALTVASVVSTSIVYSRNGLHNSIAKPQGGNYYEIFYSKPYCRIVPYLLGIVLYLAYQETKRIQRGGTTSRGFISRLNSALSSRVWRYSVYAIGALLMNISVTGIHLFDNNPDSWGQPLATAFELAFRPTFIFGVMCVLYPAIVGKGNIMAAVLGHPFFNPAAKLVYGAYMVQLALMQLMLGYTLSGHFFSPGWVWGNWFQLVMAAFALSFAASIVFESPVVALLKTFISRGGRPKIDAMSKPAVVIQCKEPLLVRGE